MENAREIDPKNYGKLSNHDKLSFLANFSSTAPSSHNMQPWSFKIQENTISIYPDFKRKLFFADLESREFCITLGTLIGNLKLISDCYKLQYTFETADRVAEGEWISKFTFTNLNPTSAIDFTTLSAIQTRHNSRLKFDSKNIDFGFLSTITKEQGVELELIRGSVLSELKPIILESIKEAFADNNFRKELAPWLKPSIGRHYDGLVGKNLGVPFLASLFFPTVTKYFNISSLQVKIHQRMLENVQAFGFLVTPDDSVKDWLSVGQTFIRIAVEAEKSGVSIGIMQGPVENKKCRAQLVSLLKLDNKPQMLFRLGHSTLQHFASPRRNYKELIR